MPPTLPVDINRDRIHDLEVVGEYTTAGSFEVALRNHGEAVHVHLHLDDALSRAAELSSDDGNWYVESNAEATAHVAVTPRGEPTRGRLTVSTGYGAESADVAVTVEGGEPRTSVEVDERLSRPAGASASSDDGSGGNARALAERLADVTPPLDAGTVLLVALAVAAVALAVGVGLSVDSSAVLLGVGVVVGGVVAALVLFLR